MDDAKELTGRKKVSQFVYCAGLLFLHSEKTQPFLAPFPCDWMEEGWVKREQ